MTKDEAKKLRDGIEDALDRMTAQEFRDSLHEVATAIVDEQKEGANGQN